MKNNAVIEGKFSLGKNGVGFVKNREHNLVIEVPPHLTKTALHKDIVAIKITNKEKNEGEVVDVVKRAFAGFTGILKKKGDHSIVETEHGKIPDIVIPRGQEAQAQYGNKVFAKIEQYGNPLVGTVVRDLGKPSSNDAAMNGIALEQGFDFSFPEAVDKEASLLEESGISEDEVSRRRDMRNTLTFTIDPADAKDFDDALSFTALSPGVYEVGIHIADVSHYVQPGTALDEEAQKRTTSVYLVDRTIPMLPEVLSNGLCSLREGEDKLAFSAVFTITEQGEITDEWFGRTVIRSDKRFTYEEAQHIIDTGEGLHVKELSTLNDIAKIFTRQRQDNGALNFETHEVRFILDEDGTPIDVKVKERIDTNKLIEELMLLANNHVARYIERTSLPFFVYRVHDKPDPERSQKLKDFLTLLGYKNVPLVDGIIPVQKLQQIINQAEGTPAYDTLQTVMVRSMQKAIYTTKNIGHYGLAFDYYTHFTSPIRRYPDVLAHRLVQHALDNTPPDANQSWYEKMCDHSSEQEQAAVTAERNSIKLKQVQYMANRNVHDTFEGIVTGASKFGLFVAEEHSRSEGMIRLSDLGNDYWEYIEKTGVIRGKKTKKIFKIGDIIKIRIKKVDLERHLIDYSLVLPKKKNPQKATGKRYHRKNKN